MEMEIKRKADDYSVVPAKKTRHEITVVGTREKAVVTSAVRLCFVSTIPTYHQKILPIIKLYVLLSYFQVPRTSNLYAPIMLLEGHQGEVFTSKFHPEGKHLASAGFDRQICKFLPNTSTRVMVGISHHGLYILP